MLKYLRDFQYIIRNFALSDPGSDSIRDKWQEDPSCRAVEDVEYCDFDMFGLRSGKGKSGTDDVVCEKVQFSM